MPAAVASQALLRLVASKDERPVAVAIQGVVLELGLDEVRTRGRVPGPRTPGVVGGLGALLVDPHPGVRIEARSERLDGRDAPALRVDRGVGSTPTRGVALSDHVLPCL